MKHNLPESLKTDLRFQALVREEMIAHQHIISCHHKEMQELRDDLKMALERFNSLFDRSKEEHKQHFESLNSTQSDLKAHKSAHTLFIDECKNMLSCLQQEIYDVRSTYTRKDTFQKFIKDVEERINACHAHHLETFQKYQQEMKSIVASLKEELVKVREEAHGNVNATNEKVQSTFSLCQMDKEGVLNEVRLYKKSMFIIEKKIEHLYLLIEKINKRGDVCHKPE